MIVVAPDALASVVARSSACVSSKDRINWPEILHGVEIFYSVVIIQLNNCLVWKYVQKGLSYVIGFFGDFFLIRHFYFQWLWSLFISMIISLMIIDFLLCFKFITCNVDITLS